MAALETLGSENQVVNGVCSEELNGLVSWLVS